MIPVDVGAVESSVSPPTDLICLLNQLVFYKPEHKQVEAALCSLPFVYSRPTR